MNSILNLNIFILMVIISVFLTERILDLDKFEAPLIKSSSKMLNELVTPEDATERFLSRGITLIYGPDGSGKTNICMDIMINAILDGLVVWYYESEIGISFRRIKSILKARDLHNIFEIYEFGDDSIKIKSLFEDNPGYAIIYSAPTLNDLTTSITQIQKWKPDVLIVDSAVSHYLVLILQSDYGKTSKTLTIYSGNIKKFCGKWNMAVLFTSQPVSVIKEQEILEKEKGLESDLHDERLYIGGKSFGHDPKVRIALHRIGLTPTGVKRKAVLEKNRDKKTGISREFEINEFGIGDVV